MSTKDSARLDEIIADYVAQLEALDNERYEAQARLVFAEEVLRDVEGSLLAYWTDISQDEIQRLLVRIQQTYLEVD